MPLWCDHLNSGRQSAKPRPQRVVVVARTDTQDLAFEEKFWDVVGLYINPPQNAVVLCCDEKSQCQALERTQTGLPLGQGHTRARPWRGSCQERQLPSTSRATGERWVHRLRFFGSRNARLQDHR